MPEKGEIYLIPSPIEQLEEYNLNLISIEVKNTIKKLNYFAVENIRTARRYIKKIDPEFDINNSHFVILNKKTKESDLIEIIKNINNGKNLGVISEAGCPGIADPGQNICEKAHINNIIVRPLIGANSIILALMASGLNGQEFKFHGYLPIKKEERRSKIINISKLSGSHIFIETPYRNDHLLHDLINFLPNKETKLCVAHDICGSNEKIITKNLHEWSRIKISIKGKPTIFIFEKYS